VRANAGGLGALSLGLLEDGASAAALRARTRGRAPSRLPESCVCVRRSSLQVICPYAPWGEVRW
jgi:hypothetical protein